MDFQWGRLGDPVSAYPVAARTAEDASERPGQGGFECKVGKLATVNCADAGVRGRVPAFDAEHCHTDASAA